MTDERREEFTEALFDAIREVAAEYGLPEKAVAIERADPTVLALRGDLTADDEDEQPTPVELVVQLSGDMARARRVNLDARAVREDLAIDPEEVARSFDITSADLGRLVAEESGQRVSTDSAGREQDADERRDDFDRDDVRARIDHLTRLKSLDDVKQYGK
ncbi:hypothetical protein [Salinirubrum litoreum]|uniref:Uncharacterized protein n=1 Tax=Salinirubrum litoreum TaxID=1126234 RepID=A0ABD5RFK9_9EURY|nr:hypothetical protein [Salinirubrum litoreum]